MKKAPAPTKSQGASEKTQAKSNPAASFCGTGNPRHLRILAALLVRARPREEIDRIAGASNGPDEILQLRARGLAIPCERTPCFDRDGHEVMRGVYFMTDRDGRDVRHWMRRRAKGGTPCL